MRVELLAICDAATDCQGRLNILGVFEGRGPEVAGFEGSLFYRYEDAFCLR